MKDEVRDDSFVKITHGIYYKDDKLYVEYDNYYAVYYNRRKINVGLDKMKLRPYMYGNHTNMKKNREPCSNDHIQAEQLDLLNM